MITIIGTMAHSPPHVNHDGILFKSKQEVNRRIEPKYSINLEEKVLYSKLHYKPFFLC